MRRAFTGRHMAAVLVAGFGVVIAVNFLMATLAVRGFGGVVVDNSYVASQKYNGWLREAARQNALGWSADLRRSGDGRLLVATNRVPDGPTVTAAIRRPLGPPDDRTIAFEEVAPGRFLSRAVLPPGRWIVRLSVAAQGERWAIEERLE